MQCYLFFVKSTQKCFGDQMMSNDREKGSKKEGEGIAELGEDKSVVEGSDANG